MPEIILYTRPTCPYCHAAKALLTRKGAAFTEIDVTQDAKAYHTMVERAHGGTTVPQIFINGRHIGGSDDLHALDAQAGLDPLLKG